MALVRSALLYGAIFLRAVARPGTDISFAAVCLAYAAIRLRLSYAMSATDLGYATICLAYAAISLRAPYAMSGTEIAYGAIRKRSAGRWLSAAVFARIAAVYGARAAICSSIAHVITC
eukprot:2515810-Rhodomonas_salina.7